ncbi:MAG: hypothetical protein BGO55_09765 [Sphingobacteriales bacterium 50-39]|nr:MAG: hypothetical protein BGO55_09765 [Sphingobacteriales bacterium 50-39]
MKEPGRVDGKIFFYHPIGGIESRIVLQSVPGAEQQPSARLQYTAGLCQGFLLIGHEHEPELEDHEVE